MLPPPDTLMFPAPRPTKVLSGDPAACRNRAPPMVSTPTEADAVVASARFPSSVIVFVPKFPLASLLTMALAVSAFAGATLQFKVSVPVPVTGDPLTMKSETGAARPTLVTVPAPPPGKVCPLAKLMMPLLAMAKVLPVPTRMLPLSLSSELVRWRGLVSNLAIWFGMPAVLNSNW